MVAAACRKDTACTRAPLPQNASLALASTRAARPATTTCASVTDHAHTRTPPWRTFRHTNTCSCVVVSIFLPLYDNWCVCMCFARALCSCADCADPLLLSSRRSGYRHTDPGLLWDEATRQLSVALPFGSQVSLLRNVCFACAFAVVETLTCYLLEVCDIIFHDLISNSNRCEFSVPPCFLLLPDKKDPLAFEDAEPFALVTSPSDPLYDRAKTCTQGRSDAYGGVRGASWTCHNTTVRLSP